MAIFKVKKEVKFETGHRLFNYEGKCHNIHGHNYKCIASVLFEHPNINEIEEGMILDLSILSKILKEITEGFDHKLLLNENDILVEKLKGFTEIVTFNNTDPTAEVIASSIKGFIEKNLGLMGYDNFLNVEVELFETDTSSIIVK